MSRNVQIFRSGLTRNFDAEAMWAQVCFGSRNSGFLFGAEDDLAYDISAWVRELGLFIFSGGQRNSASSNGEFLVKFLFSPKAVQVWDQLAVQSKGTQLENPVALLDPQIKAFHKAALTGEVIEPVLQESLTPQQWAVIHLAMLHIAAKDESLTPQSWAQLTDYLKDPLNPNNVVHFNEVFGRQYRSACMAENIFSTQPTITEDKVIVILVGLGHLNEVVNLLNPVFYAS
jgi:hypothetical protein